MGIFLAIVTILGITFIPVGFLVMFVAVGGPATLSVLDDWNMAKVGLIFFLFGLFMLFLSYLFS